MPTVLKQNSGLVILPYELKDGRKPVGARLIRPHANESVLPFSRLLQEKLVSWGIPTDEKEIEGIMQRGQPLRLAQTTGVFKGFSENELRHAATNVLTFEDYLYGARLVRDSLTDGKNIFVLELHAMNPNGRIDFDEALMYRSLNGSILVTSFVTALDHSFANVQSDLLKPQKRFKEFVELHELLASLRKFDFWEAKKELESLKKELSSTKEVAKIVEIPGESHILPVQSLLYLFYFDSFNPAEANIRPNIGDFEISYCATFRNVVDNDEKSIRAVASIVKIPPNGYSRSE